MDTTFKETVDTRDSIKLLNNIFVNITFYLCFARFRLSGFCRRPIGQS